MIAYFFVFFDLLPILLFSSKKNKLFFIYKVNQSPILSQEDPVQLLAPENLSENFPSFSELALYDGKLGY